MPARLPLPGHESAGPEPGVVAFHERYVSSGLYRIYPYPRQSIKMSKACYSRDVRLPGPGWTRFYVFYEVVSLTGLLRCSGQLKTKVGLTIPPTWNTHSKAWPERLWRGASIASAVVWSRHFLDWNAAVFVVHEPLRRASLRFAAHSGLRRRLIRRDIKNDAGICSNQHRVVPVADYK